MTHRQKNAGFTLLEMAIVLVIIGLLASVFMGFMEQFTNRQKLEEARRDAGFAAGELEGYVLGNTGKLPDPASGNLLPSEISNTKDPWGNDYYYWRADELDGKAVDSVDSTEMFIRYFPDAASLASLSGATRTISDVAYVVISRGKDGIQHFSQTPGSIYINMLEDGAPTGDGGNFDDILEYKTLGQLRTVFAASGQSGSDEQPTPTGSTPAMSASGGTVSGEGLDGVLGDTSYVAPGADVGVVNVNVGSGQALSLGGGAQDYIDLTQKTADFAFTSFTIMCWFKTDASMDVGVQGEFAVLTSRQEDYLHRNWWVTIWANWPHPQTGSGYGSPAAEGELGFRTDNGTLLYTSGVRVDDEQWHFMAASVRRNETTNKYDSELYFDGAAQHIQSFSTPPSADPDYPLYIGHASQGTTHKRVFNGLLDSFYIFGSKDPNVDGSLNATQVDNYYQAVKADYGY